MTNKEIIDLLKRTEVQNDWEGPNSIFLVTLAGSGYFKNMQDVFGVSTLFLYAPNTKNYMTGYMSVENYKEMGEYLAKKALDKTYLKQWCDAFKKAADATDPFFKLSAEEFFNNLETIVPKLNEYTGYQVPTKTAANFLPDNADPEIFELLQDARKYSEQFYKVLYVKSNEVLDLLRKQHPEYSNNQLQTLTITELLDSKKNIPLPSSEVLESRYQRSSVFAYKDGFVVLDAAQTNDIEAFWLSKHTHQDIKGSVAFPGVVRGKCRIIKSYKNATLEEGEILVTGMTDPNFLPLMHKAGAFVTDGGGLLCHAAIVARELKKPCVIGTKIATKVLKDGDMIEVDANTGIVKVI